LEENENLSSDGARAVTLTEDGNIVIAGMTLLLDGNEDRISRIFMVIIDLDGEIVWMNIIDRGQSETEGSTFNHHYCGWWVCSVWV